MRVTKQRCAALVLAVVVTRSSALAQGPADPVAHRTAEAIILGNAPRPRLVVVVSIDQFRADYLLRFTDLFLPAEKDGTLGGLRYLMETGAYFVSAQYEHYPLYTGPGHAAILTGGYPYKTGIIGNIWWDAADHKPVYCVDDDRWTVVGAIDQSDAKPMGPGHLKSSTVGDELKLASAGHAKIVAIALKDRAAILLGGHAQDVCIWYDSAGGRWISSTAFCRDGRLPAWVEALNNEHVPDQMLGHNWDASVPADIINARTMPTKRVGADLPAGMGERFPHHVGSDKSKANYRAFTFTPRANQFVLDTAARAVTQERLGQDDVPDILAINLSTNDYVGHTFGPYSPEVLDLTVQTDRQLSSFLNALRQAVPGGMSSIVFVLTADHGVAPTSEDAAAAPFEMNAGRFSVAHVMRALDQALKTQFGDPASGSWFAHAASDSTIEAPFLDGFIWFDPDSTAAAIRSGKAHSRREIERTACSAVNGAGIPGVYACYGKLQILNGELAHNQLAAQLAKAVHPQLSGDLLILSEQFFIADPQPEGHATTHASAYAYDAHVPLIVCAPGLVRPGVFVDKVAPSGIAPTLSLMLGIEFPSACDGEPLVPCFNQ